MCKPEKDDRGKNSEKHIKPSERRKLQKDRNGADLVSTRADDE